LVVYRDWWRPRHPRPRRAPRSRRWRPKSSAPTNDIEIRMALGRAGHFGGRQAQRPIDHASLPGRPFLRDVRVRSLLVLVRDAGENPLAGLAWRLPPRPRQSLSIGPCSSRGHHRNRRLIARKVLRPVPARRRFSCSISETAPRAAPGPMSGIDERVVAVRSLFSPPFPLAPLLPTLEVAGGTAVDMGRWSPPCAATDSRFRGGG